MKCNEFKEWFMDSGTSEELEQAAVEHLENCSECRQLSELDHKLNSVIDESIEQVEIPAHLEAQLYLNLEQKQKTNHSDPVTFFTKKWLPALAMAALLIVFINPFQRETISSFESISQFALQDHQNDLVMAFDAADVNDTPAWFANNANLKIMMPQLDGKIYKLVGGRKCTLGKCSAAYLLYMKDGVRVSLFIIDEKDISFDLEAGKKYAVATDENKVTVWRENDQILAMVI